MATRYSLTRRVKDRLNYSRHNVKLKQPGSPVYKNCATVVVKVARHPLDSIASCVAPSGNGRSLENRRKGKELVDI